MTEPCNTANAAEALGLRKDARRQEIARRQAQLSWRHRLEPDEDQQQGLADCAAALLGARSEPPWHRFQTRPSPHSDRLGFPKNSHQSRLQFTERAQN